MATERKTVPKRRLGINGPEVSAVGLGTMGIGAYYGRTDEKTALEVLTYAANRGMTFWDCADIYGSGMYVELSIFIKLTVSICPYVHSRVKSCQMVRGDRTSERDFPRHQIRSVRS